MASLAVRAAVLASGGLLVVLPAPLHPTGAAVTAAGVLLAAAAPRTVGSTVASAGFVLAWIEASGWHSAPSAEHTVAGAAALYLTHLSCGLAAWIPIGAQVQWAAIRRYLAGSAAPALVAAIVIALDLTLPSTSGSAFVELAGLIGVVAVAASVGWTLRTSERVDRRATSRRTPAAPRQRPTAGVFGSLRRR